MLLRFACAVIVCLNVLAFHLADAAAQTGANVLVVANEALPASVEIAEYYVRKRNIPPAQLIKTRTSIADQMSRAEFERRIQLPIAEWLNKNAAQDRILYIVLTKGIPLRIAGTGGRTGTISSVDSELALVYRRLSGTAVAPNGVVANPYFLADAEQVSAARRFSHASHDIYLVTRLDGFSVQDVKTLIDRGSAPVNAGRVVLDQRATLSEKPNEWLAASAKKLEAQGFGQRVVLEQTSRLAEAQKQVLGYASWGSNDPAMTERSPAVEFVPGALAAIFVSTDARTFTEPPPTWKPGKWESRQAYYAGSPQSLTGDLIRAGVTGVAGYVAEPYLDTSVRPDILFPAYVAGFNLAEAFYMALPALSWQAIVVGDPLCAPFHRTPVTAGDLDPPLDKETELPTWFSARRLRNSGMRGDPAAQKLVLKADARLARDDRAGARAALEEAVARDESVTAAWRTLAIVANLEGDYSKAIIALRKVLEREPKNATALNDLAYTLAVREKKPAEALPLAERAQLLEPRSPHILDTVGWIKHLLGDDAGAIKLVAPVAKVLRENAEVQLHAAVIYAALGRIDEATAALKAAEAAEPNVKERPEYREAKQKIDK
jgi:uncharacterized protein (TIGR03790 family)